MTKRARNLEAERAQQREYYRQHKKQRCRYQQKRRLTAAALVTEQPIAPGWSIVAELGEQDGIEFAKCRCARGHVAVIAVDVRPQPDCVGCLHLRRRLG